MEKVSENFKIIEEKKRDSYIKNHVILEIVTGVERPCSNIDPLGLDTVTDCLTCSNSDYKILQEDKVIKDYKKSSSKEKKKTKKDI